MKTTESQLSWDGTQPAVLPTGTGAWSNVIGRFRSLTGVEAELLKADIEWPHRAWRFGEHVIPSGLSSSILEGDINTSAALADIKCALASGAE